MKKILVVGSLNVDMNIYVDELPPKGETIKGCSLNYTNGGKGANQACAIGKFYSEGLVMLGCVGDDSFSNGMIQQLQDNNIDVSHILKVTGQKIGMAVVSVDKHGDNNIVIFANANQLCDVEYLKSHKRLLINTDYLLLQNEIPMPAITYAIETVSENGGTVVFNPAPSPKELSETIIDKIDFLTPNETELKDLAGGQSDDVEVNAQKIMELGVKNIIVTLGEKGALWISKQGSELIEGYKVKAINTVGAGDTFNGAFVSALASGEEIRQAIQFAHKAAALSVTKEGSIDAIPSIKEVLQFDGTND